MPRVTLQNYQKIARQDNVFVRQDLKKGELKISQNNCLNRTIIWFKGKISANARRPSGTGLVGKDQRPARSNR